PRTRGWAVHLHSTPTSQPWRSAISSLSPSSPALSFCRRKGGVWCTQHDERSDQGGSMGRERRVGLRHGTCLSYHQRQDFFRRRGRRRGRHLHLLREDGDPTLRWQRWYSPRDCSAGGRVPGGNGGRSCQLPWSGGGGKAWLQHQQESLRTFRQRGRDSLLPPYLSRQDLGLLRPRRPVSRRHWGLLGA
ncbi:unnamed protein product, partial [Musa hybrid cultivar]